MFTQDRKWKDPTTSWVAGKPEPSRCRTRPLVLLKGLKWIKVFFIAVLTNLTISILWFFFFGRSRLDLENLDFEFRVYFFPKILPMCIGAILAFRDGFLRSDL